MSRTHVVAVIYEEPEWAHTTKKAVERLRLPTTWVDRAGTGSLALAHNKGFLRAREVSPGAVYVWFVTNVTFSPQLLPLLEAEMDRRPTLAALHPAFPSDHRFCRPDGTGTVRAPVPFVEFTAPLVRADVFAQVQLDPRMPYWGHDLDWGYRVRQLGYDLGVHNGAQVGHTYIRHSRPHPVTRERQRLRRLTDVGTERALRVKYGLGWEKVLGYNR